MEGHLDKRRHPFFAPSTRRTVTVLPASPNPMDMYHVRLDQTYHTPRRRPSDLYKHIHIYTAVHKIENKRDTTQCRAYPTMRFPYFQQFGVSVV